MTRMLACQAAAPDGLDAAAIAAARSSNAAEPRAGAISKLERDLALRRGERSDVRLARARGAGLADAEIVETVAYVELNLDPNNVNHVARTELDIPPVPALDPVHGAAAR